jgi:hypothetical protein
MATYYFRFAEYRDEFAEFRTANTWRAYSKIWFRHVKGLVDAAAAVGGLIEMIRLLKRFSDRFFR